MLFACVDLNDLTAITPKHTQGDNSCRFGKHVSSNVVVFREDTCSPRHVTSMLLRRRCMCVALWVRSSQVCMRLGASCSVCRQSTWPVYWFGPGFPAVVVYWPLTLLLCRGDTCWVLTARWQPRFLNSWLDGSPPNKSHRRIQALEGVRLCVHSRLHDISAYRHVRLCVQRVGIDR